MGHFEWRDGLLTRRDPAWQRRAFPPALGLPPSWRLTRLDRAREASLSNLGSPISQGCTLVTGRVQGHVQQSLSNVRKKRNAEL